MCRFRTRPGRGIVLNCQSFFPVWTSKASTIPLVLLWVLGVPPSRKAEPTSMTPLLVTAGAACRPISPVVRSIGWPFRRPRISSCRRMPSSPKVEIAGSGLRIEADQSIADRDIEDAIVALTVASSRLGRGRRAGAEKPQRARLRSRHAPRATRRWRHRARPTSRRVPAVVYSTPLTISGVPSSLYSGRARGCPS